MSSDAPLDTWAKAQRSNASTGPAWSRYDCRRGEFQHQGDRRCLSTQGSGHLAQFSKQLVVIVGPRHFPVAHCVFGSRPCGHLFSYMAWIGNATKIYKELYLYQVFSGNYSGCPSARAGANVGYEKHDGHTRQLADPRLLLPCCSPASTSSAWGRRRCEPGTMRCRTSKRRAALRYLSFGVRQPPQDESRAYSWSALLPYAFTKSSSPATNRSMSSRLLNTCGSIRNRVSLGSVQR